MSRINIYLPGRCLSKRKATTADATLADQEATANANEVTTEAPQSATESENIETESNTYQTTTTSNVGQDQTASATADQQQMIALAQAASTFITANAQADKTAQLNYDNNVSGWQATQIKAIADAKLALTDSQADADQAWIAKLKGTGPILTNGRVDAPPARSAAERRAGGIVSS